ncbi:reticulocyte-binding protein PFD0110w-like isoform X1 [Biomphalaria glabrata]|nr:reticulocyte-binding protein [Biomphalaria glabrata]
MDDFKPRPIDVILDQGHMLGIEELRELVLNPQRLDLERRTIEMEIKAMETEERKQMRGRWEDKKLERELEIKLPIQGDESYNVEMDISDLNCNMVENRSYSMSSLTEYNDKSDKADDAAVGAIENKTKEIENVFN